MALVFEPALRLGHTFVAPNVGEKLYPSSWETASTKEKKTIHSLLQSAEVVSHDRYTTRVHVRVTPHFINGTLLPFLHRPEEVNGNLDSHVFEERVFDSREGTLVKDGCWLVQRMSSLYPEPATWRLKVTDKRADGAVEYLEFREKEVEEFLLEKYGAKLTDFPHCKLSWRTCRWEVREDSWLDVASWVYGGRDYTYSVFTTTTTAVDLLANFWPSAESFMDVVMAPSKAMAVAHTCNFKELFQTECIGQQEEEISRELTNSPVGGDPLTLPPELKGACFFTMHEFMGLLSSDEEEEEECE